MPEENETIQEDVSTEELVPVEVEGVEAVQELSPREQAIKSLVEGNVEADEAEPSVLSVPAGLEIEAEVPAQEQAAPELIALKINGEEVEKSLDELITIAQKQASGDAKLKRASEEQRANTQRHTELDQYQAALQAEQARLEQLGALQNTPPSSQEDAGSTNVKEGVVAALEQIYDGNTEEAAEKLAEIIGRQQPTQQIDPQQLVRQITQQAVGEIEQASANKARASSIDEGVKWMGDNYPDILSDSVLYDVVNNQTDVVAAAEPNLTPNEVIQKATSLIADKMGLARKQAAPSSRATNKQTLIREPTRQSSRAYIPPVEAKVDTSPLAVLRGMKSARHANAGRKGI